MKTLIVLFSLCIVPAAGAVGYSANLGFATTRASSSMGSVDAGPNTRFGIGIDLTLAERLIFATGTDYVTRRVTWHRADGARLRVDFDYVDVPVELRFRVASMASVAGGLRFGINVLDKMETQKGTPSFDPDARAIISSWTVAVRLDLPYAFALESFYEREIGDGFAANLGTYQTLGMRAIYSF